MNPLATIGLTLLGQASRFLERRELESQRRSVSTYLAVLATIEHETEAERARIEAAQAEAHAQLLIIDEKIRRMRARTLARELNAAFGRK